MFCSPYNFVINLNMISIFFLNKSVFDTKEEEFQ